MDTVLSEAKIYSRLGITKARLLSYCYRWQVAELSFFGSILTENFKETSDIDVLVSYLPTAKRGLIEKITMKEELEELTGRKVDLVSKQAVERSRNWIRRSNILGTAEVFYVA
ncbi:MAG: nucleotidyltransferase family protein [Phormidesmis sp.]